VLAAVQTPPPGLHAFPEELHSQAVAQCSVPPFGSRGPFRPGHERGTRCAYFLMEELQGDQ